MTGKGILKYLAYVCIGAWMFVLGIMVGRNSVPVSFDTTGLQQRLANIVESKSEEPSPKVELGFYDALDEPQDPDLDKVPVKPRKADLLAKQKTTITLSSETDLEIEAVSFKEKSIVKKTTQKPAQKSARPNSTVANSPEKQDKKIKNNAKKTKKQSKPAVANTKAKVFTIQLASFKEEKDARTCLAQLEKKGVQAGMEKTTIDGKTWHRIRIGSFNNINDAKTLLAQFKKKDIQGFIIQTKDGKK